MNHALMFADGEEIKIVIGSILKVIKVDEVSLPHNIKFLDKLFESRVLYVDTVSELTKESFVGQLKGFHAQSNTQPTAATAAIATPSHRSQREVVAQRDIASGSFVKSLANTTIIVDDLPTGRELAPGCPEYFAIHPGRAANLSSIDPDIIRKSSILRRLVNNGTLIPVSAVEACRLDEEAAAKVQAENDARLEHAAPILGVSVDAFRNGEGGGNHRGHGRDAEVINVGGSGADDPIPVHVTGDNRGRTADPDMVNALTQAIANGSTQASRRPVLDDSAGFTSLSEMLAAAEQAGSIEQSSEVVIEVPARRQLAARPNVAKSTIEARGIKRKD